MVNRRLKPSVRKRQLAASALHVAESDGLRAVTYQTVALQAGVSLPTVQKYYPTKAQLTRDLMRLAIRDECLPVIAEGVATRCPHAAKAPTSLKRRAVNLLGGSV